MKTYRIDSQPKNTPLPTPDYPTVFSDFYKAESEDSAIAKWRAENQAFCGGNLMLVRVRLDN